MIRRRVSKRVFDVIVAGLGLMLGAPFLAMLGLCVFFFLGSPVLFRQRRPGLGGQPFTMLKFRTMRDAVAADGRPLPDQERLTKLGRLLRATSLDELPELVNVLRGEMSLVGPRPLLMEYMERYTPEQARRHDVPPGITGWAQVNGRNGISWEDKFQLDVWYIDHWSFWLDVKIILMTLVRVWQRDGVQAANHATMPEFLGSRKTTL